jgi:hypothetical protein
MWSDKAWDLYREAWKRSIPPQFRFRAWNQFDYGRYGYSTGGAIILGEVEPEIVDQWLSLSRGLDNITSTRL